MKKFIALLLAMVMCLSLFAGCGEKKNTDLAAAREYLFSLYVDKSTETATDLEYPARVKGGNTFFDVEWTVEILSGTGEIKIVASENEGFVVVDVPAEPAEDIKYKLTATIKAADGATETLVYEYTVPKFKVTSFAEYAAAENGTLIVAQGVVTGILSKANGDSANGLYFQDNDGGFYAYNLATDPVEDGIEVGMTVRVTGEKDLYNGTYEIVKCSAQIINAEKTPAAAADWTEVFVNAADTKDASLTAQQSFLVTLKGVTIGDYVADKGYLNFELAGKTTYLRISSSNCPILKAEETTVIETFQTKKGNLANVTGLVTLYNGAFYLTPVSVDCFEYLGLPEKSDAEAVEFEKSGLTIDANYDASTELELPTVGAVYDKVAITWSVEGEGAAIVDGKLVITVPADGSDAVATLTATLTAGDSTDTVSFTLNMSLPKNLSVLEAIEKGAAMEHDKYTTIEYFVTGIITEVYNTQYGNMKIQDAQGNILTVYGTYSADGTLRYDALEVKPVAGDLVTVYGIIGQYNGTPQVKNGWIVEHDTTLSVKGAIDMGAAMEHNKYTAEKYVVTGVITEVYNTQYGNMKITDEDGNILTVYGTYSADGTLRYDALETKPVAGDTVTVYGIIGQYTGKDGVVTPQMKNGWIVVHTPASSEPTDPTDPTEPTEPTDPTEPSEPTDPTEPSEPTDPTYDPSVLAAQIEEANKLANGEYLTVESTITGTITDEPKASSYTEGAYKFTVSDGTNTLLCYYVPVTGGTPKQGDTVTVTGYLTAYNGAAQFKEDKAVATLGSASAEEPTEPTEPTEPSEPAGEAPFANGDKIVIYATAHNKALSTLPSSEGSFYQMGVDVTVSDGTVSGYAATEVWTVIANDDGTYSFAYNGQNLGMQDSYSSMSLGAVNDKWELVALENGSYALKNVVRGYYVEWYASKNNWSTYSCDDLLSNNLFHLSFFVVE